MMIETIILLFLFGLPSVSIAVKKQPVLVSYIVVFRIKLIFGHIVNLVNSKLLKRKCIQLFLPSIFISSHVGICKTSYLYLICIS